MDDTRTSGPLEGADDAAAGTDAPPRSAPPGAATDASEHLVPGAGIGADPPTDAKPWSTSLAAASDQAGVANDAPAAQDPQYPEGDDEAL